MSDQDTKRPDGRDTQISYGAIRDGMLMPRHSPAVEPVQAVPDGPAVLFQDDGIPVVLPAHPHLRT